MLILKPFIWETESSHQLVHSPSMALSLDRSWVVGTLSRFSIWQQEHKYMSHLCLPLRKTISGKLEWGTLVWDIVTGGITARPNAHPLRSFLTSRSRDRIQPQTNLREQGWSLSSGNSCQHSAWNPSVCGLEKRWISFLRLSVMAGW